MQTNAFSEMTLANSGSLGTYTKYVNRAQTGAGAYFSICLFIWTGLKHRNFQKLLKAVSFKGWTTKFVWGFYWGRNAQVQKIRVF